jgi:hypothetical protein
MLFNGRNVLPKRQEPWLYPNASNHVVRLLALLWLTGRGLSNQGQDWFNECGLIRFPCDWLKHQGGQWVAD